jgi:hypothetical protein
MDEAKVDTFVLNVKHVMKCYAKGKVDNPTNRKRKHLEEDSNSNLLPTLRYEIQRVEDAMREAPP